MKNTNVIQLTPKNPLAGTYPFVQLDAQEMGRHTKEERNPPGSLLTAPDDEMLDTILVE